MTKEKYGVVQTQVDELVKLGTAPEEAIELVASGEGPAKIKEARAKLPRMGRQDDIEALVDNLTAESNLLEE